MWAACIGTMNQLRLTKYWNGRIHLLELRFRRSCWHVASPENMHNSHFGLSENMHKSRFGVSKNMHRGARLVIFDYSVANISPRGDLKYPRFYAIMVTVKIHLARSLRLGWGGKYDMRFEVWPQFWPFTGSDYVGIMDFAARKSTDFGQKSTEKHSKWGKRPLLLSLGPGCCRFESCHFDQKSTVFKA